MDDTTISLNAQQIVEKVFTKNVKGYDADEVDSFLDKVALDYVAFEKYYVSSRDYIIDLETRLGQATEAQRKLELQVARLNQRVGGIKEGTAVTQENIALLQKIQLMENKLYSLGIDPSKL